jgi:hypothetical protein
VTLAFVLTHWFQYNYAPRGQPFYLGADRPNAFILLVLAPAGCLWSRTKWWPLRPIKRALTTLHSKLDAHHKELHARLDAHEEMHRAHAEKLDRLLAAQGVAKAPSVHTEIPVEETT